MAKYLAGCKFSGSVKRRVKSSVLVFGVSTMIFVDFYFIVRDCANINPSSTFVHCIFLMIPQVPRLEKLLISSSGIQTPLDAGLISVFTWVCGQPKGKK
jgi:hypothetical protein